MGIFKNYLFFQIIFILNTSCYECKTNYTKLFAVIKEAAFSELLNTKGDDKWPPANANKLELASNSHKN